SWCKLETQPLTDDGRRLAAEAERLFLLRFTERAPEIDHGERYSEAEAALFVADQAFDPPAGPPVFERTTRAEVETWSKNFDIHVFFIELETVGQLRTASGGVGIALRYTDQSVCPTRLRGLDKGRKRLINTWHIECGAQRRFWAERVGSE